MKKTLFACFLSLFVAGVYAQTPAANNTQKPRPTATQSSLSKSPGVSSAVQTPAVSKAPTQNPATGSATAKPQSASTKPAPASAKPASTSAKSASTGSKSTSGTCKSMKKRHTTHKKPASSSSNTAKTPPGKPAPSAAPKSSGNKN